MVKKKFITEIDYNKSAKACLACSKECEKIDRRINNRKLSEIKNEEVPHILKLCNFQYFLEIVSMVWVFFSKFLTHGHYIFFN